MLKKVLIAFDGSEPSRYAFTFALNMVGHCMPTPPEISVVAVVQLPDPPDITDMDTIVVRTTEHYKTLFKELEAQAKEMQMEIKTEVLVGNPADQIIAYAKEHGIDMLFAGQTGKSMIETWLMGSVSQRIVTHAHCPVAIIK